MTKNTTIAVAIGIVCIVLGAVVYTSSKSVPTENTTTPPVTTPSQTSAPTTSSSTPSGAVSENIVNLTVEGKNFSFSPTTLSVKKGDTVKITFKNAGGFHDFVIDEFAVATPQIQDGGTAVVEFVADKVGIFEYYCSVGNHRAMGMKGTVTVTE